MKAVIAVAAHKPCWVPSSSLYLPVQAGSAGSSAINGFQQDNCGENISIKNRYFCELTVLYWLWKNIEADYLGLVHYRRYFSSRPTLTGRKKEFILKNNNQLARLLQDNPIIMPRKRRYFVESKHNQFVHAHGDVELNYLIGLLNDEYAEYMPVFTRTMKRRWAHIFNMFIMRRDYFDAYCRWLFDILFKLEHRIKSDGMDAQPRIFGFLAERLLDVWLEQNELAYLELPVISIEKINWPIKIISFLGRKLMPPSIKHHHRTKSIF